MSLLSPADEVKFDRIYSYLDDFFSSSNGNATSKDDALDQAVINIVPVPNDIQGGSEDSGYSGPSVTEDRSEIYSND